MSNFFLIDHSLRDSSGHHRDYAQCIAQAANEMGFLTTIGANRKLPKSSCTEIENLGCQGVVRRTFRNTTYQPDSYLAGLRHLTRSKLNFDGDQEPPLSPLARFRNRIDRFRHTRRRERYIRQFAEDCERFFRNNLFTSNDHAFFTTVSELELMGLAVYLSSQPRSMQTHWHLQFHFNLFDGRPPEYDSQNHIAKKVRNCFLAATSRLAYHAVNFYTTSDELADQYNRLGVGHFDSLPYPIAQEFSPTRSNGFDLSIQESVNHLVNKQSSMASPAQLFSGDASKIKVYSPNSDHETNNRELTNHANEIERAAINHEPFDQSTPIKITCPGGIRREKGHLEYLQPLVDEIWEPYLASGRTQLVLQRPKRKSLRREKLEIETPGKTDGTFSHSPIVYFRHPLSRTDYIELIRSTDIGLLYYDSRIYYSRRAGVLGELLACGKPVIVPGGCWLAKQIQEPIFEHADRVVANHPNRCLEWGDFRWESQNVPMPGGVLSFDQTQHPFNFEVEINSDEELAALTFDWHWPAESGVYCRAELSQLDSNRQIIKKTSSILGHRDSKKAISLFTMDSQTKTLRFSLKNAFHNSTASVKNVQLLLVKDETEPESGSQNSNLRNTPLGSVGVIAADQNQLADCIHEVVEHLDHYQQSAQQFADRWYARHQPERTVAHLIAMDYSARRVA